MSRTVVLIDSGFLKYSTRFVARNRLGIAHDAPLSVLAEHPKAQQTIYDVLATSLRSKLGTFERNVARIDRCIICLDIGDSWRVNVDKTVIPDTEQASSIAYKGHRRSEDPDELAAIVKLNRLYDTCLKFICNNSGIELIGKKSLESDDFMIVLGQQYAKQGDAVFILSKDADITQAVCYYDNGGCVIIMQPTKEGNMHFVVDHATFNSVKDVSIFGMAKWPIGVANVISNAQVLAPQYMLLHKIMNGDASDDISPVMVRVSPGGRTFKLREADMQAIFDEFVRKNPEGYFKIENCYENEDILTILSIAHQRMFKTSFNELPDKWRKFYVDKFIENRKMVVVNKEELGEHYHEVFAAASEQLHGTTPTIAFPTWDILQQLNL